jgi:predicted ATP-dependent endonuclease of OLD family
MGIKLGSLRFSNYLGVASEPVEIQFNPRCTVLCGPNNSGKTTVLAAISLLAENMRSPAYSAAGDLTTPSVSTSYEMFNSRIGVFESPFEMIMTIERSLLPFSLSDSASEPTELGIGLTFGVENKTLKSLTFEGADVFHSSELRSLIVRPEPPDYLAAE